MNGKLLAVLRQDIDAFEEKIYEFTNGEIDRKAYKGFSGGFGSYAQRENGYSMLRLRLPGGRLTKEMCIRDSLRTTSRQGRAIRSFR